MRVTVTVTFDGERGYFTATIPGRHFPVIALSLRNLQRQVATVAPGAEMVFDRVAAGTRSPWSGAAEVEDGLIA